MLWLTLVGLGGGATGLSIDLMVSYCYDWRITQRDSYVVWVSTAIGFVVLALNMV